MSFTALLSKDKKKLIKIAKRIYKHPLDEVKLPFLKKLFKKVEKKRGKPIAYDRSKLFRLVCEAYNEGKSASNIARYAKKTFVKLRYWVTKSPSHNMISDFLNELAELIDDIFNLVVKKTKTVGLFKTYVPKLMDTTDIETKFKSDPDAQRNWSSTKKCWYWGYGGLLIIEAEIHLPCARKLTYSKKINAYKSMEVTGQSLENVEADIIIGDPEFDMQPLISYTEKHNTLFVVPYNSRNSTQSMMRRQRKQKTNTKNIEKSQSLHRIMQRIHQKPNNGIRMDNHKRTKSQNSIRTNSSTHNTSTGHLQPNNMELPINQNTRSENLICLPYIFSKKGGLIHTVIYLTLITYFKKVCTFDSTTLYFLLLRSI